MPLQASGRVWREPGIRAGTFKSQNMSSEWEKKMRDKAHSKAFKEARNEVIAARKAKLSVRQCGQQQWGMLPGLPSG